MKKYKKAIIISLCVLVVLIVGLLLSLGFIIEKTVQTAVSSVGPAVTGAEMSIGGVSLNPFRGRLDLSNIKLGNPKGLGYETSEALKVGKVAVELDLASLLSDKIIVREITIKNVDLTMEMKLTATNISDIQKNIKKFTDSMKKPEGEKPVKDEKAAEPAKETEGKKLQVDLVDIDGVTVNVSASGLGGQKAGIPIPQIKIENMGKSGSGITVPELIGNVLNAIMEGSVKGVAGKLPELKMPDLKSLNPFSSDDKSKDSGSSIVDGVKSLFK